MRLLHPTVAAAAALGLAACAGGMSDTQALSASASGSPAAATAPSTPAAYVSEAARSDMYEIQSGQMAQTKGASQQVKDFGAQMIRDHTMTTTALTEALTRGNMAAPPTTLDDRRQGMLSELNGLSGAAFDTAYLRQQRMAHQEALALHQGYAQAGDVPPLKAVAAAAVPHIQHHISMLQTMPGG